LELGGEPAEAASLGGKLTLAAVRIRRREVGFADFNIILL
jgi:hypothetical protein